MEEKDGSSPISEDINQLSIVLLREWWVTATEALVNEVGVEAALALLKPGWTHHGTAGAHLLTQALSLDIRNPQTIAYIESLAKHSQLGGPTCVEIREDGFYLVIDDCQTGGQSQVLCKCVCDIGCNPFVKVIDPENEVSWVQSKANGDETCRMAIKKRGAPNPTRPITRIVHDYDLSLSKEQWDFWCRASIGENWAITIRAMVEGLGEQRTVSLLRPYLRQSGLSLGTRLSQISTDPTSGKEGIYRAIQMVSDSFGKKMILTANEGSLSGQVSECPFSGSSPAVCGQFEAFYNGICEAVFPDYEFVYEGMMTKGAKTCRWVLRKKSKAADSEAVDPATERDDMLRTLKWRLVRGEITRQEFEALEDLVRK